MKKSHFSGISPVGGDNNGRPYGQICHSEGAEQPKESHLVHEQGRNEIATSGGATPSSQ